MIALTMRLIGLPFQNMNRYQLTSTASSLSCLYQSSQSVRSFVRSFVPFYHSHPELCVPYKPD
ncbi:hypothetical protein QBC32DRAFT_397095 [Pseudoneurospora amorphoporcata]|uniref:Uncharacterized protein n=1 Tax=Pseudoneurospora amorphoporcata TaxID=241081 RepID=A0AAN6NWL0_9PEZI|nr:hypothetical protein QBC32DRAFT_397095 [Pseudoneurospora amorphoporcata]